MDNNKLIDNSELFFKIYRNIFLKNEISRHLKLYMEHGKRFYYNSLTKFKYKDYINQLFFPDGFNHSLGKCKLNYFGNLSSINFGEKFNQQIQIGQIPHQVQSIRFGLQFNSEIHELPNQLLYLYINLAFEQQLDQVLPPSLTHLEISSIKFENRNLIRKLPPNLKYLKIDYFKEIIKEEYFPKNLKYLIIPRYIYDFNNSCSLPESLEYIHINSIIPKKEDFHFPIENLKYVLINFLFHLNIDFISKSKFLKDLHIKGPIYQPINLENLHSLESLSLVLGTDSLGYNNKVVLPTNSLTNLNITYYGNRDTRSESFDMRKLLSLKKLKISFSKYKKEIKSPFIPESVTKLIYDDLYTVEIEEGLLPNSIKKLQLPNLFSYRLYENIIPRSVEKLTLPQYINFSVLKNCFPTGLKTLVTGNIDFSCIPVGLEKLVFTGHRHNKEFFYNLPPNIKELHYSCNFSIEPKIFPESLTFIDLGNSAFNNMGKPLLTENLPKNLKFLNVNQIKNNNLQSFIPNENFKTIESKFSDNYDFPQHLKKYLNKSKKIK